MILVPATAMKLGKLVPHVDQFDPLSVEKRYSSCDDMAPPVPAVVTEMVNVAPTHTAVALGLFVITGPTGTAFTVQLTEFPAAVVHPEPVENLLDSTILVPTTATKLGIEVLQDDQFELLSVEKRYSSCDEMAPPVPAVEVIVKIVPEHTSVALGFFAIIGPTGTAFTVQITVFPAAVVHPAPVEVRRDSMILVPATAVKLGKLVPHDDQIVPLSVEKRYSSCDEMAPPVPAVGTDIVNVAPTHTDETFGFFTITGPTGTALTVQLTVFPEAVVHPEPVEVLLDSIVLVPVTAVKFGIVVLHNDQLEPLLVEKRYSSCEDTAPPVPAVVTEMVNVVPAQTSKSFGFFAITGPTGTALTVQLAVLYADVVQPLPDAVRRVLMSTDVSPEVLIDAPEV